MKRSVAVAILNWNGRQHLKTYLPSVLKYSQDAEIYVIDNDSTDDSIDLLKNEFPQVKIIINSRNGGFARGYNEGLKSIKEDYYILLNSDVEVSENWISPIINLMESDEKITIAQPKMLAYRQKDEFEYAGAAGGFIDYMGYPFCRGRIFQSMEKDEGQYDDVIEIFWATGACMFIKRATFWELDGFDDRYFAHMEEIDLCWRAKNVGYKVYYNGMSKVYHLGGGTINNTNPRKTFLNFRNSLLTLHKNDRSGFTHLKVLLRLLLDAPAMLKLAIDAGFAHAIAILKAHFSYYGMKKKKSKVDQPNQKGVFQRMIVLDHFLKGKMKFSQLKKDFS